MQVAINIFRHEANEPLFFPKSDYIEYYRATVLAYPGQTSNVCEGRASETMTCSCMDIGRAGQCTFNQTVRRAGMKMEGKEYEKGV